MKTRLNSNHLKIIAILAMTIDHIVNLVYPGFPNNPIAIISHFAYCSAFGIDYIPFRDRVFNQTSVIWPLFWAIVVLWILNGNNKLKELLGILRVVIYGDIPFNRFEIEGDTYEPK